MIKLTKTIKETMYDRSWVEKLTPDEREAIIIYTSSGTDIAVCKKCGSIWNGSYYKSN